LSRRIIVHSLAQASAAVDEAAALAVPVTLLSAPGAGAYAGPGWFKSIVDQAAARHPEIDLTAVIDCGAAPGMVLAALRGGFKHVRYTGADAPLHRLHAIAAAHDAIIETEPCDALDLRSRRDAARLCRDYLAAP
jgi:hypothetical protein